MWKAFVECCCGASERAPTAARTPVRNKTAKPSSRSASSSARRAELPDEPEPDTTLRSSSNAAKKKPILIAEESTSSEESSTAAPVAPAAVASSSTDAGTPPEATCTGTNYLFYQNRIPSQPKPGGLIDDIHKQWYANYSLLEYHHGYIQWLFPVFESGGMSFHSDRLEKEEAAFMRKDLRSSVRLVKSYKMMLDFYGMTLLDYETGTVGRAKNYKDRYDNLNTHGHNYLRISRMLMSLGELGFVRYKIPWMVFMKHELESHNRLVNCRRSYTNFWAPLCDPTTPGYKKKTREEPEDRQESVFFDILTAGGEDWESIKRELDAYPEQDE